MTLAKYNSQFRVRCTVFYLLAWMYADTHVRTCVVVKGFPFSRPISAKREAPASSSVKMMLIAEFNTEAVVVMLPDIDSKGILDMERFRIGA